MKNFKLALLISGKILLLTFVSFFATNLLQAQPNSSWKTVTIQDHGYGIPMGTLKIPSNWQLNSQVTGQQHTAEFAAFQVELLGPSGEVAYSFPPTISISAFQDQFTGQMSGMDFNSFLYQVLDAFSQQYGISLQTENIQPSERLMNVPDFKQMQQMATASGTTFDALEVTFSANKNGKAYRGKMEFYYSDFSEPQMGLIAGIAINTSVWMAPTNIAAQTENLLSGLALEPNPQWLRIREQVMEQENRQIAANNQRTFQEGQRRHHERQAAFQAQNDAWYHNNLGAGSTYNSSASFIDANTGHTSFDDPHTGHQIRQEGHYNYWFTDGQGQYHGTNDASFNPASLGTQWQSIRPLGN